MSFMLRGWLRPIQSHRLDQCWAIPADQFNHCVVAVKKTDGSFVMLDPTWSPFNMELWSRAESEQYRDQQSESRPLRRSKEVHRGRQ
jgi:hypothetical protein